MLWQKVKDWYYARVAEQYLRRFHDFQVLNAEFHHNDEEAIPLYWKIEWVTGKVNDAKLKCRLIEAMHKLQLFMH